MLEGISKPGWDPEYDSLCVNCIVAHIKWTPHTVWVSLVEDLQCLNRKLLDIGFQLWLKFVLKLYLAHMNSNAFRTLRVRGGAGVLARRERGRERLQLISGANHLFKFFLFNAVLLFWTSHFWRYCKVCKYLRFAVRKIWPHFVPCSLFKIYGNIVHYKPSLRSFVLALSL